MNRQGTEGTTRPLQPETKPSATNASPADVFPYPIATSAFQVSPSFGETILTPSPIVDVTPKIQQRIILWHSFNELQSRSLAEVIAAFQEINPYLQVEEMFFPFDDLKDKFTQATRSGNGPALLLAPQEWIPNLYDEGLIQDLSGLVDNDLLESLAPAGLAGPKYKGGLPALPYRLDGVVLYRNLSVIAEPAITLDEFIAQAVDATGGGTLGAYLDLGPYFSLPHLAACGGRIMDENGMPAFNNPSGVCWLDLLRSFQDVGLPWLINSQVDAELFKAGRVGMIIDEVNKAGEFSETLGEENLAIDPWPDSAQGHLSGFVHSWVVMMRTGLKDEEREASQEFIQFLLSLEAQRIFADSEMAGFIPSVEGVDVSDRLMAEAHRAFKKGTAFPLFSMNAYWDAVEGAIRAAMDDSASKEQILEWAVVEIKGEWWLVINSIL